MAAVVLLTLQAIAINRLAGIAYPLWNPIQEPSDGAASMIDVSHGGARIDGIRFDVKPGEVVHLVSAGVEARFRVIWVGESGSAQEGQIGLQSLKTDDFEIAE